MKLKYLFLFNILHATEYLKPIVVLGGVVGGKIGVELVQYKQKNMNCNDIVTIQTNINDCKEKFQEDNSDYSKFIGSKYNKAKIISSLNELNLNLTEILNHNQKKLIKI